MKAVTISTLIVTLCVLALVVAVLTRPVPTASVPAYRSHDTSASYGGSAYGGRSQYASSSAKPGYPCCSFDGNYANDKPGACPTSSK